MSSTFVNKLPPLHDLISNIGKNNYCALFFIGATSDIIIDILNGKEKRFRETAQKDFKFWNSLVYFFFTERTEEDIGQLLERLDQCSCPMEVPGVHEAHLNGRVWEARDIWGASGQRVSRTLVQHFFQLLTTALDQAHIRAVAKGISKFWPTSPNDLIPFGPNTFCSASSIGSILSQTRSSSKSQLSTSNSVVRLFFHPSLFLDLSTVSSSLVGNSVMKLGKLPVDQKRKAEP